MSSEGPSNILVPTDFSAAAEHALRYGASLGERFGSRLHLLHVITLHQYDGPRGVEDLPDPGPYLAAAERAARERLDAGARHAGAAAVEVIPTIARGVNAWDPILDYAERQAVQLIVIGMRSHSSLARFLLGSVCERVLRFSPCPVLVVEPGDRDSVDPQTMAVRLRRVVVADDLSAKTDRGFAAVVGWLAPYRPQLHWIHAVETDVRELFSLAGIDAAPEAAERYRQEVEKKLLARASAALPAGWKVTAVARHGRPHRVVTRYAAEVEADLLLVAGETQIDLGERVLGGTVERIARHAPCPLLVV